MLAKADLDGDGCISFEEFDLLSSTFSPVRARELRDAFDHFDSDGDGRISFEELLGFFSTLGDGDLCRLSRKCTLDSGEVAEGNSKKEGRGNFGIFQKRAKTSLK